MDEAPTAGSVPMSQGFVHTLAGSVRVAEVLEGMKAHPWAMAEASVHTLTDLVHALHPIVQKTAGLIRVA
jgi:hypothetical protein